tara:strand:+ start:240 stop:782 length:543 start_codon:yes stop_codon:yes gene_type:complete
MLSSKKRGLGILGGSFDPPHKGHLKISRISLKKLKIKKVYWILTKKNPFKKKSFYSLKERLSKCKKLLQKSKNIKVIYLDDRIKSSRTINILNYFKKYKNKKALYLIIGSDNLINFHKWKSWKKIVKMVKLVVFSRKGYDKKSKVSIAVKYLNKKNIIFVKNKKINVSSSEIKTRNFNNK